MKHWHWISLAFLAVTLAVVAAAVSLLSRGTEQASADPALSMAIDMDITDGGPCTDIDDSASHSVGASYDVAICLVGLPSGDYGVSAFSFDLEYDDTLNECVDEAGSAPYLDDNPDINAGSTHKYGDGIGGSTNGDWSCKLTGAEEPLCDVDGLTGPQHGVANANCLSTGGPYTMGDDETAGVLAVVSFNAVAGGGDTLHLANLNITGEDGMVWVRCDPGTGTCLDGSDDKQGEPPPSTGTPTATPTVTETPWCGGPGQPECPTSTPTPKAWTPTPTPTPTETVPAEEPPPAAEEQPPPPPPPAAEEAPLVVPPPTGSGPADSTPWLTILVSLMASVGALSVALGGLHGYAARRR